MTVFVVVVGEVVLCASDVCNVPSAMLSSCDAASCGIGCGVTVSGCNDSVGKIGMINEYWDVRPVGHNLNSAVALRAG